MEKREFRNVSKKLVEAEERTKLLKELLKNKVCLREDEEFVRNSNLKFRVLGEKMGQMDRKREEFLGMTLKYKIRDNILYGVKVRRKRDGLRRKLEEMLGKKSLELRQLVREVNEYGSRLRLDIRKKNKKKVKHLVAKYGKDDKCGWRELPDEWREYVGRPKIFDENVNVQAENVKDPVLVCMKGEEIILTEDERAFLKLGPKFCLFKD